MVHGSFSMNHTVNIYEIALSLYMSDKGFKVPYKGQSVLERQPLK